MMNAASPSIWDSWLRATTVTNASSYAETLRELSLKRQLIVIGEDLVNEVHGTPKISASALVEMTEQRLFDLAENKSEDEAESIGKLAAARLAQIRDGYKSGRRMSGMATGLTDLDAKLSGMQNANLITVAGRPSMGKSMLASNIAYHAAAAGNPTEIFSLEMSKTECTDRIIAERINVPVKRIWNYDLTPIEMERFKGAAKTLQAMPLHIDDRGSVTMAQLAIRARRAKRQRGTKLIVVDYIQCVAGTRRDGNRVQEISAVTRGLKAIAKELNCPVLALSQLSRAVEQREDKRPQLSDLRDSGTIEQDSDVVLLLYRDEYYAEREKPSEGDLDALSAWTERMRKAAGRAEVIIGKNRHGPVSVVNVAFDGERMRFSDLAHECYSAIGRAA
jgi:replicative DNA helicase